jgi:S-DNA-T family DNA segregation ATPase FtsK/SpoIIIE
MMVGWTYISDRRGGRKTFASRHADFRSRLKELRSRLAEEHEGEIANRRASAPDAAQLVDRATRLSPDLWERRSDDADFLELRVGVADQPTRINIEVSNGGSPALVAETEQVIAEFSTAAAVPATVPLGRVSAMGVSGPHDRVVGLGRWLVAQAAILHSPRDLVIAAAIGPGHLEDWEWLKWLPHARTETSPVEADLLAGGSIATRELLRAVSGLVSGRRAEAQERYGPAARRPRPHVLLIIDEAAAADRSSVGEILAADPSLGVSTLWLGDDPRDLPGECGFVAELDSEIARLRLVDVRSGAVLPDVAADAIPPAVARDLARSLAAVRDTGASGTGAVIPRRVSLLELLELVDPDPDRIGARWDQTGGLGAPIGMEAGVPLVVDLRRDGPHGLIAGTTGAGKSELLQSLVASLAASHPPNRVSFLLIDYKGGAAFKDCARLPHTVGMVTDLDAHLTQRALTSLNAELRRREALLRRADAKDLADMEARDPGSAPASLLIVIDEFATLAREVPAFVDGVVDVAQRGRSLGVHLILATQRPGGVVSENIRANTNLRIALRVATPAESEDVIASREAARIPRTLPGRAYSRTGHSELTPFQAAYVGGRTGASVSPDASEVTIRPFTFGQPDADEVPTAPARPSGGPNDLKLLVAAITATAADRGIVPPPSPWLPALEPVIPRASLEAPLDLPIGDPGRVVLGLIDEPGRQLQAPLILDLEADGHLLIYGASGAGKTAMLRSIAVGLSQRGSPEEVQIYGLDFASRGLGGLSSLPHCGAIVIGEDDERVVRLVSMLRRTIDRRKDLFARAGSFSLTEYQRSADAAQTPRIVLLLDSYAGFVSAFERVNGGALVDTLPRLVADGRSVGVHVIATADRRSAVPPAVANIIARKLVLRMADDDEYAALGLDMRAVRGARLPPGRGFTDTSLEFQAALVGRDPSGEAETAELVRVGQELTGLHGDLRAPAVELLPTRIDTVSLPPAGAPLRATIALTDDELLPLTVDVSQSHFLVAGPYHSGRSTALATLFGGLRDEGEVEAHLLAPRERSPLVRVTGWASVALGTDECVATATRIAQLIAARRSGAEHVPMLVVIDDAGELADVAAAAGPLETVVRRGRDVNVRVLMGIEVQTARVAYVQWIKEVRKDGHGILLDPDLDMDGDVLGVRLPRRARSTFPPGRGYYVEGGTSQVVQVARSTS